MAYFFKLPPVTELTSDQGKALNDPNAISISGGAGTGKTIISIWRHLIKMRDFNQTSVLVTYTKTLGFYLQMSLHSIEDKNIFENKNLLPPSKQVFPIKQLPLHQSWQVSEIIIDEAQDLEHNILQQIAIHAKEISYGADFNQQLYNNRVTEDQIEQLFPNVMTYNLQKNFRNTYHILNFVKSILPNFSINQNSLDDLLNNNKVGIKPKFLITSNIENEIDKIIEIIDSFKSDTHNIAILLPFGNSGDESVEYYCKLLMNKGIECSKYYNEMKTDNIIIENIHITTYKSAKGLEFDTVIIPFIHKFKDFISRNRFTRVNEEDYYVAFTRSKSNLYLFSHNELDFISNSVCDIIKVDNIVASAKADTNINEYDIPF